MNIDPEYTIDNESLKTVTEVNDLGIVFNQNLSFESHILMKVGKANALAGMIRRTFTHLDNETFKLLFVYCKTTFGVWSTRMEPTTE